MHVRRPSLVLGAVLVIFPLIVGNGGCTALEPADGLDEQTVATVNRGVGLMGSFDYDAAREVFAALVEQHPDHPDLLLNLAIATLNRQKEGDEKAALDLLARALEVDPDHVRARYTQGVIELFLGRGEAALEDFEAVLEARPESADAAYFMGQCLMQLDRPGEAVSWYERAIDNDPYLRSAYYRGFQALQRMRERDRAMDLLSTFQKLADNPRARLVEFKYTKMGRLAEVVTIDRPAAAPVTPVAGAPFVEPATMLGAATVVSAASVSVADVTGDGMVDLFAAGGLPGGGNAVVVQQTNGAMALDEDHPLAQLPGVRAALWGDLDNDGFTDVYLCRDGENRLLLGRGEGRWEDVTEASGAGGGERDTVDGALVDADHDGDLDVFLVNADGDDELLNNNRDGTFRPLAADHGLTGDGRGSRSVLFADLDHDRDADIVVLHDEPPHAVYENLLLWEYRPAAGLEAFQARELTAVVAGDGDVDGRAELYAAERDGVIRRWTRQGDAWRDEQLAAVDAPVTGLSLTDVNGDGDLDLVVVAPRRWSVLHATSGEVLYGSGQLQQGSEIAGWALVLRDPSDGPEMVVWPSEGAPQIWAAGPGRAGFLAVALSGAEDVGQSMRSNASGIGAGLAVRVGSRWTAVDTLSHRAAPGQDLQPVAVGLGGAPSADFIAIDWSDGVFQTELALQAGTVHRVTETQRQLSSCPVLFAWDGEGYAFVSDILGVGGIGYALGPPGEYGTPRPWERLLLPDGVPVPRDGRLSLKVAEPMEEVAYLDSARLVAYDLPPGWSMTIDERMGISPPEPTGEPVFYRTSVQPVMARNERGMDVTGTVLNADQVAAPVGELDHRFIGRLAGEHVLTLRFAEPLDQLGDRLVLVADGWVEYPYSQTNFAAWQAGATYEAPSVEARGADGVWREVWSQMGYPAGMPRQMSAPLPELPAGARELRLRTNQEVYWDRIAVAVAEPCPQARRLELPLLSAELARGGFARRTTGPQRLPHYDDDRRLPVWDTRIPAGWYTATGPVTELVASVDDAVAIIGPGEEVRLDFAAPEAQPPSGWTRRLVLESEGWCKDVDLFTRDGDTVGPLPHRRADTSLRDRLHERYNTRYLDGRE